MAAIVHALDNHTSKQIGENGHIEYGWSNNIREKISQFSFQVTRTNDKGMDVLSKQLRDILIHIKKTLTNSVTSTPEKELLKGYLSVLYKIIGHTRDIIDGKGEYALTYMMIYTWYDFYPELAFFALKCLIDIGDKKFHPYGSWKDFKYFCSYCKKQGNDISHPLIKYSIKILNEQLGKDLLESNISLVAKWIPREKSSFGWLYESLACEYFKQYMLYAYTPEQQKKAILKCKTEYRKILSLLNKKLDTLQIKQCEQVWSTIDFDNVTSISIMKQKKALLNININGTTKYPDNQDRQQCADNFKSHIQKSITGEKEVKGKRVGMEMFTQQALQLLNQYGSQEEKDLLNSQWRDSSSLTSTLGKMIAMVDVSGSMEGDPLNVAIALGIRIAEKSALGKRVLTFSSKPSWVNLAGYDDFISEVNIIKKADWGMNTNFYAAMNLILNAIIENKMAPEDVQDLILVILSDMQIDDGEKTHNKDALYESIDNLYAAAGERLHGKPFKPPHILFWNLRSTSGFPSLSTQSNASMMSGFSPVLLNLFCEQGIDALQSATPWSQLERSLDNPRYKIMYNKFMEVVEI